MRWTIRLPLILISLAAIAFPAWVGMSDGGFHGSLVFALCLAALQVAGIPSLIFGIVAD